MNTKILKNNYGFVVAGGGLAGVCTALSAARNGIKTALIQNRPVLGGNSSSEIRVSPDGTGVLNGWDRATGILQELLDIERANNHEWNVDGKTNSIYDLTLYDACRRETNLDLFLNTQITDIKVNSSKAIESITAIQLSCEKKIEFFAPYFADCTGDGFVAFKSGCEYKIGPEASYEYNEEFAPESASNETMGSSLLFRSVKLDKESTFIAPDWAYDYSNEESMEERMHSKFDSGYWWIELSWPLETVKDNEQIKDELLKHVLGVWDHIKNHCTLPGIKENARNYALDWVGFVPGKRESRRFIGDYVLTEKDVAEGLRHFDDVCYSGWFIDIHKTPMLDITNLFKDSITKLEYSNRPHEQAKENPKNIHKIFPIPFRCLYAKDLTNLFLAGRNISASRIAFGAIRTQEITGQMGQVVGTAAAICLKNNITIKDLSCKANIKKLQNLLIKDDIFIPWVKDENEENLALKAQVTGTSEMIPFENEIIEELKTFGAEDESIAIVTPFSTDIVDTISLWVEIGEKNVSIELSFERLEDIWDNEFKGKSSIVWENNISVDQGYKGWLDITIKTPIQKGLYRLVITPDSVISLGVNKLLLPGIITQVKGKRMWSSPIRLSKHTWVHDNRICMKVSPPQKVFSAEQVCNGWSRPTTMPNIWISDPKLITPQSVELKWNNYIEVSRITIIFDTNLNKGYRSLEPFRRPSECVKDYCIEAFISGRWVKIAEIKGNYMRKRDCAFSKVTTNSIRVTVLSTNGDKSARIYEVRVY